MVEKKNEETVAKLYAIRAGMSVISKERDAFRADFAAAKKERLAQEAAFDTAQQQQKDREDHVSALKEKYEATRSEIQQKEHYSSLKDKPVFILFFGLGIFGLALAAFLITGWAAVDNGWTNDGGFYELFYGFWQYHTADQTDVIAWVVILLLVGIAVGAIGGGISAYLGVGWLIDFCDDVRYRRRTKAECVALKEQMRREEAAWRKAEADAKRLPAPAALASDHRASDPDFRKLEKDLAKKSDHIKAGTALYALLVSEYSSTLDPRDWKNVDYLIYTFETGRARDLTDALQMCDRELQTQRVEMAVMSATAEITATIKRGLGDLRAQVETCFYNLSKQIDSSTAKVTEALAKTNAQIEKARKTTEQTNARLAGVQKSLAKITTAAAMNNALLEKANESSSTLADDVHRLRLYAGA